MFEESLYDHSEKYLADPSFSMMPMHTLDTMDFSGRARVYLKGRALNVDLMVQSVQIDYGEQSKITPHIGDTYSSLFFGKAPMRIMVTTVLPDSGENYGKTELLDAYKNALRLTAVSMTGNVPALHVKGMVLTGPWVGMSIAESSENEDNVVVVFTILVTQIDMEGDSSSVHLDYVSGLEATQDNVVTRADKQYSSGVAFVRTGV